MAAFRALRVSRTYTQTISFPPDKVFPLLCPVQERLWLEGWDCTVVYAESGRAEAGCVFTRPSAGEPDTVWQITQHDAERQRLQFAMVTPGIRTGRLDIDVRYRPPQSSEVHIRYVFTALSERGNEFIRAYTDDAFQAAMQWWGRSMNHYLATGKMLTSEEMRE